MKLSSESDLSIFLSNNNFVGHFGVVDAVVVQLSQQKYKKFIELKDDYEKIRLAEVSYGFNYDSFKSDIAKLIKLADNRESVRIIHKALNQARKPILKEMDKYNDETRNAKKVLTDYIQSLTVVDAVKF